MARRYCFIPRNVRLQAGDGKSELYLDFAVKQGNKEYVLPV